MKGQDTKHILHQALSELHSSLRQGDSEVFLRHLETMCRFHYHFCTNCLLIASQSPQAVFVAGHRGWRQLGRSVRKGEQGIRILTPLHSGKRPESDENAEGSENGTLREVSVFDISQTHGVDLPQFDDGQADPGEFLQKLEELIRSSGIRVVQEDFPQGTTWISRPGEIAIGYGVTPIKFMAVLAHELARRQLDEEQQHGCFPAVLESQAEAVSYLVCGAFGFYRFSRNGDFFPLSQGDTPALAGSLERIQRTAARIIDSLQSPEITAEQRAYTELVG